MRIAASLKDRLTAANVIMQRLTGAGPADRVAKALTALGRLAKPPTSCATSMRNRSAARSSCS